MKRLDEILKRCEGLTEFLSSLDTQDNRCTAKPIIIALQTKELTIAMGDLGQGGKSGPARSAPLTESPEDLGISPDEILYWKWDWVDRAWFFTYDGYNEHLQLNRHNYRGEVRDYVYHAFRNPEISRVIDWVRLCTDLPLVVKALQKAVCTITEISHGVSGCTRGSYYSCGASCVDLAKDALAEIQALLAGEASAGTKGSLEEK